MKNNFLKNIIALFLILFLINIIKYKEYSHNSNNILHNKDDEYFIINDNKTNFDDKYFNNKSFEIYSKQDYLNRSQVAFANLGIDLMPKEERKSISHIKPTGWQSIKYDSIPSKYLYNRCHLIGFQLSAENDTKENLITCTKQANTGIMYDIENEIANYIKQTKHNVLYRVTPIYIKENLVATGIQIEACSVIDNCNEIEYNIYIYNTQKNINIDYLTGNSEQIN